MKEAQRPRFRDPEARMLVSGETRGASVRQTSRVSQSRLRSQPDARYPAAPLPFLEATADAALIVDAGGLVVYANDRMQHLSGYAPEELIGHPVEMLVPIDAREVHRGSRRRYVTDGLVRRDMGTGIATRLLRRDRTELPVDIALTPLFADGRHVVLAAVRDMSDRQALVAALEDSERWLRSQSDVLEKVARNAPLELTLRALAQAAAARSRGAGCTVHILDEHAQVLRLRAAEALDAGYAARVAEFAPEDAFCTEGDVPDIAASPAWVRLREPAEKAGVRAFTCARVVKPGTAELIGIVALHRPEPRSATSTEVTTLESAARLVAVAVDHEIARSALSYAATHDQLTGLPNRFLLLDRLERVLPQRRHGTSMHVGIVFLDLDQFKLVNDSLGHSVGDRLLVAVGRRIAESVRPSDTLARFGGDEFVVLCERVTDELHVVRIAQRLLDSLQQPITVDGHVITVSASAGVSIDLGDPPDDAETMIREADAAMYRAKEQGGGRVAVFDTQLWRHALQRFGLESELRHAIGAGELRLVYQPEVLLSGGAIVGAEALVRWAHPTRGLLTPDEFIPLAEQRGLIGPLGAWVLDRACADGRRWQERGVKNLIVSVNVSTRQLVDLDFVGLTRRTLEAHRLHPATLCVEVTESAAFEPGGQPAEVLSQLREMGVGVALDDFGTGHASLATLRTIPADIIKVDRSFVAGLRSRVERVLTAAVITMAHRLGTEVVAEGIETGAQERMLAALGCSIGQGYFYARPVDAEAFAELLGQRGTAPISRVDA